MCSRPFETRSLPSSLTTTHRGFAFYVAFPISSIHHFEHRIRELSEKYRSLAEFIG
jgi:hypothetical protein